MYDSLYPLLLPLLSGPTNYRNEPKWTEMNREKPKWTFSQFPILIIRAKIRGFLIFWGVFFSCVTKLKIDLEFGILTILAGCGMRNVFLWWRWDAGFFSWLDAGGRVFHGRREGGRSHSYNWNPSTYKWKNLDLLKWLKIHVFLIRN